MRQLERVRTAFAKRPAQPVLEVVGQSVSRHLVLLGQPGSGKSPLTRFLLLSVLDPPKAGENGKPVPWVGPFRDHLPLLIELRDFIAERDQGRRDTFLRYWHALGENEGYSLNESWLDDRLRGGPSLVMFDGLDEIFDPAARDRITRSIVGFASTYPKARIVVTSRPVGYREKILRDAEFRHFALEDLDEKQIETFVRIRDLIRERAENDQHVSVRRTAVQMLVSGLGWEIRLTLAKDLDGVAPFLDPLKPIAPKQLRRAAERLGIDEAELRRRLAECREILGWNPLEGVNADGGNAE